MTADWEARERDIRERVARQGFMAFIGAEVEHVAPGYATISLVSRPELLQQMGYLHGGCLAFLMDNAAAMAAATLLRPGQGVLTAEFKMHFLAPAKGEKAIARGRVIKAGRSMTVSAADIYVVAGGVEKHVATGTATIAVVAAAAGADL